MPGARIGVDEAGKGPVLGSMFVAAVRVRDDGCLPDGLADSKTLTPARRSALAGALADTEAITVATAEITPAEIDRPATDMNTLTVDGHAAAATQVATNGDALILDAGDTSESRFGRRVGDRLDADCSVRAEHGADEHYPIVAAASIIAKVARDDHIDALADDHPELVASHGQLGSGYPSDPTTRSFLESYVSDAGTAPPFARSSWSTCEDLLAAQEQSDIDDF